jgi:hypothetical protein
MVEVTKIKETKKWLNVLTSYKILDHAKHYAMLGIGRVSKL